MAWQLVCQTVATEKVLEKKWFQSESDVSPVNIAASTGNEDWYTQARRPKGSVFNICPVLEWNQQVLRHLNALHFGMHGKFSRALTKLVSAAADWSWARGLVLLNSGEAYTYHVKHRREKMPASRCLDASLSGGKIMSFAFFLTPQKHENPSTSSLLVNIKV